MVHRNILKKQIYKDEHGFTLIECIIAIAIISISCGVIFNAFGVVTNVNASVYEKDKANVFTTKRVEEIKKDPYTFLTKYKDDEKTILYNDNHEGSAETKETEDEKAGGDERRHLGFDMDYVKRAGGELLGIRLVKNYSHLIEYYDSNWNLITKATEAESKSKAEYIADIEVNRRAEVSNIEAYEPTTTMDVKTDDGYVSKDRYLVISCKKYFSVLLPDHKLGKNNYIFWVLQNYSYSEYLIDIQNKFKGIAPTAKQVDKLFNDKISLEGEGSDIEDSFSRKFPVQCYTNDSIPVRVDFGMHAKKSEYEMDVYNMADKPMDLYILHSVGNDSEIKFHVEGGYVNKTEADISKKINKTVYDIKVNVKKKNGEDLLKYKTQKYIHDEQVKDW